MTLGPKRTFPDVSLTGGKPTWQSRILLIYAKRDAHDVTYGIQEKLALHDFCVMRIRWKCRGLISKKLLWLIIVGLGIVIIYFVFHKNVTEFEKEWTCEELGAEERLKKLVSGNFQ